MDLKAIFTGRFFALTYSVIFAVLAALALKGMPYFPKLQWAILIVFAGLTLVGIRDLRQTRHAILRNYPIIGHLRFFFEKIRPEMRQYFFEGDTDGRPFPREHSAIVYQRETVVPSKAQRVKNFHHGTIKSLAEMPAAMSMHSPADLKPQHISSRVGDGRILSLADLHPHIEHGALLKGGGIYGDLWANASAERFG